MFQAAGDAELQERQLLEAADQEADVIFLDAIDAAGMKGTLQKLRAEGVRIVILNDVGTPENLADAWVCSGTEKAGELCAEHLSVAIAVKGEIALFLDLTSEEGRIEAEAFEKKLAGAYPDMEVCLKETMTEGGTSQEEMVRKIADFLHAPGEAKAIFVNRATLGEICLQGLKAAGKEETILLTSSQISLTIRDAIMEGKMLGAPFQFFGEIGIQAAELGVKLLSGNGNDKKTIIDPVWASQGNTSRMGVGGDAYDDLTELLEAGLKEYEKLHPGDIISPERLRIFPGPVGGNDVMMYLISQNLGLTVIAGEGNTASLVFEGGLGDAKAKLSAQLAGHSYNEEWSLIGEDVPEASEEFRMCLKRIVSWKQTHPEEIVYLGDASWLVCCCDDEELRTISFRLYESEGKRTVWLQIKTPEIVSWMEKQFFGGCDVTYVTGTGCENPQKNTVPAAEWKSDERTAKIPENMDLYPEDEVISPDEGFAWFRIWNRNSFAYELIDGGRLEWLDGDVWREVPARDQAEIAVPSVLYSVPGEDVTRCLIDLGRYRNLSNGSYRYVFEAKKEEGTEKSLLEVRFEVSEEASEKGAETEKFSRLYPYLFGIAADDSRIARKLPEVLAGYYFDDQGKLVVILTEEDTKVQGFLEEKAGGELIFEEGNYTARALMECKETIFTKLREVPFRERLGHEMYNAIEDVSVNYRENAVIVTFSVNKTELQEMFREMVVDAPEVVFRYFAE
ncbi:MAG: sugar ABC transporter substrate-binding protein [Lachnospiraceae bacterium]|nr:sugar ABC transporter substrate-binding protein [Lachnospiraceae bacterium]